MVNPRLGRAGIAAALYLAAMILLSGFRPLWLDEILQLLDTRQPSAAVLLRHLPVNHAGSGPLAYLAQQSSLKITGYSMRNARLPAAVFGGAAVLATILLASELGLPLGWAGWLFAVFPLTVRYATEARMYSQALFFSVLATLLYVRLAKKPGWKLGAAYCLALVAAAYTQPYAVSVGVAHVLWSLVCRERKAALFGGGALAAAALAFLPWYLWSRSTWAASTRGFQFAVSWKTPLMLFREIAGAGYWGSLLLLVLCGLALAGSGLTRRTKALLALLIAMPLLSGFAADALSGYFLAARQFLWVLPALAILAGSAAQRTRLASALLILLSAVCVWQSVRFFTAPHDDWQAASDAIWARTRAGACLSVAPPEQAPLYAFFHPDLQASPCDASRWILALTPASSPEQRDAALDALQSRGYQWESTTLVGGSRVSGFGRADSIRAPRRD